MVEQISAEDLTEFLDSLRRTSERIAAVYRASDLVCFEICEGRLEEHIRILIATSLSQNSSSGDLFEVLEDSLAVLVRKMSEILIASCFVSVGQQDWTLSCGASRLHLSTWSHRHLRVLWSCQMHGPTT